MHDTRAPRPTPLRLRIVSLLFVLAGAVHVAGLCLLAFGVAIYANYPGWRHALMGGLDLLMAFVAARRPRLLVYPIVPFCAEQLWTHGGDAWRHWTVEHRLDWYATAVVAFFLMATVIAIQFRTSASAAEE